MTNNISTMLGLDLNKLKKRQRPDLDLLANKDMSEGVEYPVPAHSQSNIEKNSNQPEKPEYLIKGDGLTRLPDGRTVEYRRLILMVDDSITLYSGNPRYGKNPDVTSLRVKIKKTKGNVIPVIARTLENGQIEIIAGSRRMKACSLESVPLTIDLLCGVISDDLASLIAYMENQDRDDTDVFEDSWFYKQTYELIKKVNPNLFLKEFSEMYSMSEPNMSRYMNIANIPEWLCNLCPRFFTDAQGKTIATWSLRKAMELEELHRQFSQLDEDTLLDLKNCRAENPDNVLKFVSKALKDKYKPKSSNIIELNGLGTFEKGRRKATIRLVLNDEAPIELKQKIEALLGEFGLM